MSFYITLWVAFLVFSIGLFGVLSRRHLVAVIMGIELMFNAANLSLVAIGLAHGVLSGQIVVLFAIAVTVAEVAVGLALFLLLERIRGTVEADEISLMKG
ncbi:MAG: NADH-quinone oxidoreductase subunit K [Deltaproteobacteria bacterium]|jgi:NADH:ubiquinone oxidoreductase subunit K|nr:NADH-quinone oxidoreductase subunit K [bacterium HR37]GIW47892.1 MAG: NADH-quinone oxidoreductase subunit K [Deltaproteobacteria bacterium]